MALFGQTFEGKIINHLTCKLISCSVVSCIFQKYVHSEQAAQIPEISTKASHFVAQEVSFHYDHFIFCLTKYTKTQGDSFKRCECGSNFEKTTEAA